MHEEKGLDDLILDAVSTAITSDDDFPFRHHLGASLLGSDCELQLFFSFRWVKDVQHESRIERIFSKGRREEIVMLDHLEQAGLTLTREKEGQQIRAPMPPHLGGSTDAILHVPASHVHLYGHYMPIEVKTHKQETFNRVKKKPLYESMPQHWCQANIYAVQFGMSHFMYYAKNKNNEEYHLKIYEANPTVAKINIERGSRIVVANIRESLGRTTAKHKCNMCDYKEICKMRLPAEAVNCRSCKHAFPMAEGTWLCNKHGKEIIKFTEIVTAEMCGWWESIV